MNEFEKTIKAHLDDAARNDSAFAAKYTPDDKKKGIASCCAYIITEVKKTGRTGFTDAEVYGMAMHFYDEGLTGPSSSPNCRVVVNHDVKLSPEDEAAIREKARREAEERIRKDEADKIAAEQEKARKRAEKAKKKAEAKKAAEAEARKARQEEWEKCDLLFGFDDEE